MSDDFVWGGWRFDAARWELTEPRAVRFHEGEGRVFYRLLQAQGHQVDAFVLGQAGMVSGARSANPKGLCALRVSRLRGLIGRFAILSCNGAFRLVAADQIAHEEQLWEERKRLQATQEAAEQARQAGRSAQLAEARAEAKKTPADRKRENLVALFKDQFEATGPHARAVSRTVMRMFGEE